MSTDFHLVQEANMDSRMGCKLSGQGNINSSRNRRTKLPHTVEMIPLLQDRERRLIDYLSLERGLKSTVTGRTIAALTAMKISGQADTVDPPSISQTVGWRV